MAMKVAYMLGSVGRGGTETLLFDVVRKYATAPFAMIGIYRRGGAYEADFCESGVPFFKITPHKGRLFSYLFRLRRVLLQHGVQIVHAQQSIDALYARLATMGTGVRVVQTFHGYDYGFSLWVRFLLWISMRWVDANYFVSNAQMNYYIARYRLKSSCCSVVYNGVNFEKFDSQFEEPILPTCDPATRGLKLGMVGNFVRGRAQNFVCHSLSMFKEMGVPFDFYFVGGRDASEPWRYESCVAFCQAEGLSDRVHFLGARADVPAILPQLDAFVYATDHDTFGIAVVEAMAAGVPVLVNDWEVMCEVTQQGAWAMLYETGNAKALCDCIVYLSNHLDECKQQAAVVAQEVQSKYSIDNHLKLLYSRYQQLL